MREDEITANENSDKKIDPDVIDLPRRAIGTPQVLAGFIFLLSLQILEV